MNDLFILWIMFQLIFIGYASAILHNEIVNKTYDCSIGIVSPWQVMVFPLVVFVPEDQEEIKYCEGK